MERSAKVKGKMGRPVVQFPMNRAIGPEEEVSDLLTLLEVRKRLGVHQKRVYVLVQEGKLHPVRMPGGKRIFYAAWEVEALLSMCYVARVAYGFAPLLPPSSSVVRSSQHPCWLPESCAIRSRRVQPSPQEALENLELLLPVHVDHLGVVRERSEVGVAQVMGDDQVVDPGPLQFCRAGMSQLV